ncbi:putative hydroxymethylpyrimidine transporter CytX [Oribacterium sp. P6A1]|uniref:putative hydroxymethylpyrimidine transporter CytX n=1 Tax=Oribacterium sp. P6A1 TaxID=1410612 RepID=UPI00056A53DC|nr:putative hydroxymethylpyrimidine transporter CytX [Oribacterium sp. P6A1]
MEKKTTVFDNALIWFGAGVSIAEILTGTYLAPLGFQRGLLAVLLGHLIGGVLFYLAGMISGQTGKSAMETVKMTFGNRGGMLFAALNVLQLVGWTAIMIYDGALSAAGIWNTDKNIWCLIIGGLIILWIMVGVTNLGKLNRIAMTALFILSVVLCVVIVRQGGGTAAAESISFGAALELSVSMPLSWLPVVGDYTREAGDAHRSTLASTIVYNLVSCWMFLIGMGAALLTGTSDIAEIMLRAGLGAAGLLIIVFSTVTTTFLDAFSAGISGESLTKQLSGKSMAIAAAVVGIAGAVFYPMDDITGFLYLIGSVFAPMAAVMIGTWFVLKTNSEHKSFDFVNLLLWLAGFVLYRYLMQLDIPVGYTLPDILFTTILTVIVGKVLMADYGQTRYSE